MGPEFETGITPGRYRSQKVILTGVSCTWKVTSESCLRFVSICLIWGISIKVILNHLLNHIVNVHTYGGGGKRQVSILNH